MGFTVLLQRKTGIYLQIAHTAFWTNGRLYFEKGTAGDKGIGFIAVPVRGRFQFRQCQDWITFNGTDLVKNMTIQQKT